MDEHDQDEIDSLFLVCYDYGIGGLWACMYAPSEEAVGRKYPELFIAKDLPTWMTSEDYAELLGDPLRLDDPPTGILDALIGDRRSRE